MDRTELLSTLLPRLTPTPTSLPATEKYGRHYVHIQPKLNLVLTGPIIFYTNFNYISILIYNSTYNSINTFNKFCHTCKLRSRDSAVYIATSYGLDGRGFGVQVPVESKMFSSPCRPHRLLGHAQPIQRTPGASPGG
jgi:hypothetical protein